MERAGQCADAGQNSRREHAEAAHFMAVTFATVGDCSAAVSRVEQSAQLLVVSQPGVALVSQYGRGVCFHEPEQHGDTQILGQQGARNEKSNHVAASSFPAAFVLGADVESW